QYPPPPPTFAPHLSTLTPTLPQDLQPPHPFPSSPSRTTSSHGAVKSARRHLLMSPSRTFSSSSTASSVHRGLVRSTKRFPASAPGTPLQKHTTIGLRASSAEAYAEEQRKGLKRVDFLMGCTTFMGLSSTKLGPDVWVLNLQ
ncbi:uncharacterized protein BJ212DRAFT_1530893, partial [Suillus subaureus]